MNTEDINFSILCENHNCREFDCGDIELNDFLVEDALSNQISNISITRVASKKNNLIGYYSILTDSIKKEKVGEDDRVSEVRYSQYPAIKIGRLAINKEVQRKGHGRYLLMHALAVSTVLSEHVGCRFITLDSKNTEQALKFYEKNGFKIANRSSSKDFVPMYLDLHKVNHD